MPETTQEQPKTVEDWLESHSRGVKSAKISHAIISPGSTLEQALVKSTLRNEKQLNGLMLFMLKLEDRGMGLNAPEPLNSIALMIQRKLIGSGAIYGKNIFMAAETDIGVIDQAFHQSALTGKGTNLEGKPKKAFGFLKKREDREDASDRVR